MTESRATELKWIFRPRQDRPDAVRALAGASIHSAGPVGPDGEADFVVAHPEDGLLTVEVKGGTIIRDSRSEEWTSIEAVVSRHD